MPEALPFSQACENNRGPILEVLQQHLLQPGRLLEIGSGTGQHAVWLAPRLPHIQWQPSDLPANLPGIRAWMAHQPAENIAAPLPLDVESDWPDGPFDYIYTANTFHIMSEDQVLICLQKLTAKLTEHGMLLVYGPFRYQGQHTADSNARFDTMLRQRDPLSGIRDYEWICDQATSFGLRPVADHPMPANNHTLVFRKKPVAGEG